MITFEELLPLKDKVLTNVKLIGKQFSTKIVFLSFQNYECSFTCKKANLTHSERPAVIVPVTVLDVVQDDILGCGGKYFTLMFSNKQQLHLWV